MEQILNYKPISVGRAKDYTNQIINNFIVLYRIEPPKDKNQKSTYWLTQCQLCQTYKIYSASQLSKQQTFCECQTDLTNHHFGRWIVLYKTDKRTKNRNIIYHCKCECGNEKDVDAYTLRSGQSKSCGCLQKEIVSNKIPSNKLDLTGKRFGKLIALYPIKPENYFQHTKWHCQCDCGNTVDVDLGNLQQGFTKSCGCVNSKQEEQIIKILTINHIPFVYQYRFNDLKMKSFDFFVNNEYIIEYDGEQHFNYNGYGWNTKDNFEKTRKSDLEKNQYCFKHNIPIIRIPYTQENKIKLEDLLLQSTNFLLTSQNEDIYYSLK